MKNIRIISALIMIIIVSMFLTSCSVHISGLTQGYKYLSEQQKAHVLKCDVPLDSLHYDGNIYRVNEHQLREYIDAHDDVVLYEFNPICHSQYCVDPAPVERELIENGVKVLMIFFCYEQYYMFSFAESPVLIADSEYYGTNSRLKIPDRMINALTGNKPKQRNYADMHYFKRGQYIGSFKAADGVGELLKMR